MPDRKEAISHLQIMHTWADFAMEKDINYFTNYHFMKIVKWTEEALELLKEFPGNWISVEDKLPETNDEVLITYFYPDKPKRRFVQTASYFYDGEEGHWSSVWDEHLRPGARYEVAAWMPLPKPKKEEKDETD